MSLNDAIDIIEQVQKLSKQAKKEDVKAEIKKCWGKLEDLAREEQVRIEGAEGAFVAGKQRKIKRHCNDQKYRIAIISYSSKLPLEFAQKSVAEWIEKEGSKKKRKYEVVKADEVV